MNFLKMLLRPFTKPMAVEIVKTSLDEYQRQLLIHEASAAYHDKMAQYYSEGIVRLGQFQPR